MLLTASATCMALLSGETHAHLGRQATAQQGRGGGREDRRRGDWGLQGGEAGPKEGGCRWGSGADTCWLLGEGHQFHTPVAIGLHFA